MKKIIIACDSFKGSATSREVNTYLERGILDIATDVEITKKSISDGGEGLVDCLLDNINGEKFTKEVTGPLGEKVLANYAIFDGTTAVIELAASSGYTLVSEIQKNPFITTTFGAGEIIKEVLDLGVKKIYLGLGGSITNDAGMGLVQALGGSFTDHAGHEVGFGAAELSRVAHINLTHLDLRLAKVAVIGLCDVGNKLLGREGASYIFGPQKGASEVEVVELDNNLKKLKELTEKLFGTDFSEVEGSGAAGGTGYGLLSFLGGELVVGIDEFLKLIDFDAALNGADLVITGEGMVDGQTLQGKAPIGVAKVSKKKYLPVIVVAGSLGHDFERVYREGIDLVIDTIIKPMSLEEALVNVESLLHIAGQHAYRAFSLSRGEY